jgi:NTE family protein
MFNLLRLKSLLGLLLSIVSIAPFTSSDVAADARAINEPKICLVLKGGGALGFAHVGVLKVLEELRIPVHCIAGTSMGSIVGAAYAAGSSIEEMDRILNSTDWDELFGEKIRRETRDYRLKPGRNREILGDAKISIRNGKLLTPAGVIQGQNIRPLFQGMFGDLPSPVDFDSLPVPFRAVTADIETGEKYVPARGDLASVVRASMSVPGAFAPVEIDGRLLVDGGIANNLPVEVALEMGADVLVVVDLQSELAKRDALSSPISISGQMISLLLLQNSRISRGILRPQDVVIEPNVSAFTALEFAKGPELMKIGEAAARAVAGELSRLSVSQGRYDQYQSSRAARESLSRPLSFVRIKENAHMSEERIAQSIRLKAGDAFSREIVEEDIQKLYQTGYFQSVQYSIVKEGGGEGLEIEVREKDWLSNFFRVGFALEDDFDGNDSFRFGLAYRVNTTLTEDGYGEAQMEVGKSPRFALELYQPIGNSSPFFLNTIGGVSRNPLFIRQGGEDIAEYARSELFGVLNLGRRIGTSGEYVLGIARSAGKIDREIGDPLLPEFTYQVGELSTGFDLDTLDKPDFSTVGYRLNTKYRLSVDALGADDEFGDLSGAISLPYTMGRNTVAVRVDAAHTFGERPIERSYSLGGFGSVSGFAQNSLVASQYVNAQLLAFRRFSEVQNPLFDMGFFVGGSLEFTNIQNDSSGFEDENLINSGSVFVGADTPLLPLYFGFGLADTGDHSLYLILGRVGQSRRNY